MTRKKKFARRSLTVESLEERRVLAASVGWDGPGAGSTQLSYYIGQAPNGVTQANFENAVETALKAWSDVANIKFVQTSQPGLDRSLDFTSVPIDGSGGTLAQAYFPSDVNWGRLAGDVQFDSSERWEIGNSSGNAAFDLVLVAAHEIGHALGLDHLRTASAVLYPSVSASQSFNGLAAADVSAIRSLYATNPDSTNTTGTGNTGTGNTGTGTGNGTEPGITRTTRFTRNSWFASWFSKFGRVNGGPERLDSGVPAAQNLFNPLDTNLDDAVSPIDALIVINMLNNHSQISVESKYKVDTNGDGKISPIDALLVINGLRNRSTTTLITIDTMGEGPVVDVNTDTDAGTSTESDSSDGDTPSVDSDSDPNSDPNSGVDCDNDPAIDNSDDSSVGPSSIDNGNSDDDNGNEVDSDSDGSVDNSGNTSPADEPNVAVPDADKPDNSTPNDSTPETRNHPHDSEHFRFPLAFGLLAPERVDGLFKRFDANADDFLTEDELPSFIWSRLIDHKVDANDDSKISLEEVKTAIRAKQQEKFDKLDDNGDGTLTETELPARLWSRLTDAKADTNGDGGISLDELLAFRNTVTSNLGTECDQSENGNTRSPDLSSQPITFRLPVFGGRDSQPAFELVSAAIRSLSRRFRG